MLMDPAFLQSHLQPNEARCENSVPVHFDQQNIQEFYCDYHDVSSA